jgi:surface antigen
MLDALIVAAAIGTASPTQELLETNITSPTTSQIEEQKPPELTLQQKIDQNVNNCNTDLEWIRADDATCKPKAITQAQTPVLRPYNTSSAGNTYAPRNCTWYAKSKRPDLPNNLGNANTWVSRASAQGIATGSVPKAGAIGQQGNHVVYIERVNGDVTVHLSEMNFDYNGGFRYRNAPASNFSYIY